MSLHTVEYYSAMKRNEALTQATMWMNLENMMLSERSQTQKATYHMIPFLGNVQKRQIHRDGKQMVVARGWGGGVHGE